MKSFLRSHKILFLFVSIALALQSHASEDPKVQKKKSYSKSYPVNGNDKISLNNQFGAMKFITWEKNEVKVDVDITGKADDDKRAQEILDKISIEDGKSSGGVYFKTKFAKDQWDDNNRDRNTDRNTDEKSEKHKNEGMEINYTVYLPAGNPLNAENQFGAMTVPDYRGEATLVSKFGSLTTGKITNGKNVSVEFGKADIGQLNGGKLTIKFSSGTVSHLTGDVDAVFEFCDKIKMNVDNDVKDLDIKNSYSTLYLDLNKNFSANYDISTSYGEFKNKTAFAIKEEGKDDNENHYGPKFNHRYTGTSGSGSTKVKIKSSFGEIIMGHDLVVDMSETKHKGKTRTI
jgi:hypothetical protein